MLLASVFFGINVYLPVWNYGINVCNMLKLTFPGKG